jgi:undecaprenyl-diphosphatase
MNEAIFFFFYNLAHQSIVFDKIIIFFADIFPYIFIILVGLFLLFHHEVFRAQDPFQVLLQKKKEILLAFFSGALAWVLAYVLKLIFHTPRPFDLFSRVDALLPETGYAFPSGHATFFMALAVSVFLIHKQAGRVFIFLALIIGLARVIAGVHFPIDILGGFLLGSIVSTLVAYFVKNV